MKNLLLTLSVLTAAPVALAQNCFNTDVGVSLGGGQDIVLPIQAIGFPFPVNGVTYTDIHITDHGVGYLSNGGVPAPPLTNDTVLYTPTTANFAAGSPKVCCLYTDVIADLGEMFINSSPTQCVITWRNVHNFGYTQLWQMQMTLYPSGNVMCVWDANATNASTWGGSSDNGVVGITQGGGAALPAGSDLSAGGATANPTVFESWTTTNTFDIQNNSLLLVASSPGYGFVVLGAPANCASVTSNGTGCGGLALAANSLPSFGNAGFQLDLTGANPAVPLAFVGFGDTSIPPGIDLSFIGMSGCFAYTSLNLGLFTVPTAAGTGAFVLPIPNTTSLAGALLAAQGLGFDASTPLGLVSSNGFDLLLGY